MKKITKNIFRRLIKFTFELAVNIWVHFWSASFVTNPNMFPFSVSCKIKVYQIKGLLLTVFFRSFRYTVDLHVNYYKRNKLAIIFLKIFFKTYILHKDIINFHIVLLKMASILSVAKDLANRWTDILPFL